ncbi:MAG TPA: alpha/beta hydrolase [Ktedonobacteraceae bacterium]
MKAPLEPAPPRDQVLSLRDGRVLGYTQTGNPSGKPVFFFHGSPGSRLQRHPDETIARDLGARLIGIDRPGYGLSDFQLGRTLLDWPADVAQLADALHIERFAAIGLSGGAPYLLACAHQLPQRLTSAIVISGMGPLSEPGVLEGMMPAVRLGLALVQRVPWWLLCLLLEPSIKLIRLDPIAARKVLPASFPEADQAIFAWRDLQALDREDLGQAYRQGGRAFGWDLVLLTRPWGFRLQDIPLAIHLWQGEEDTTSPVAMGRYLARILPACEPHFCPGEGHTLVYSHWREILSVAVS